MGMPNPFAAFPITDGWDEHRARGSLGGIDWGTPVGTPIYSPNPGTVTYEYGSGTGGYIITLALANSPGYRIQFLHCSSFNGSNRTVKEGELLGYTGGAPGAPGAGSSTGPHVHVHMIDPNGVRENPLPWFAQSGSAPSSSNVQAEIQSIMASQGLYSGAVDGSFGPNSWRAIQTWLAKYGLYSGSIDGIPGTNTYKGFQSYAAKNGNYDGPIDGALGPRSWAGFLQTLKEDTKPAPAPTPSPAPPKPVTPTKPVPHKPGTTLSPGKQEKLNKLLALKKEAESKLKEEKAKLPALLRVQKNTENLIKKCTDAFNKAKAAFDAATANLVKAKNDKVIADKGINDVNSTIATLEKSIAKYTDQINKIK